MAITYSVTFGLPNDNLVRYDCKLRLLKTIYCGGTENDGTTCVLYSPTSGLKLFTNVADGEIIGLEAGVGSIDGIAKTNLPDFDCTDGCVKAEWDCGKLLSDCSYLIDFTGAPAYDSNKGFVVFGDFSDDSIAVRICRNAFLSVDAEGKLCGIAIKI